MRLFSSRVFSVCCALSFVVGFAMLGAITFLPAFLQYVDGVSATESGLRTLPLVIGLLTTSIAAGTSCRQDRSLQAGSRSAARS